MAWPVYVCTRGRAGRITREVLSLCPTLIVEPGEEQRAYAAAYPLLRIRTLTDVNRGVAFARNGAKQHAQADRCAWWWLLDDDLYEFRAESGPVTPAVALSGAEAMIAGARKVALAGLQSGGTPTGQFVYNRGVYCGIAVNSGAIPELWWREDLLLKEDTELCLRVLTAGWNTLLVTAYSFRMPACGTEPGGLFETYARRGMELRSATKVAARWRRYAKVVGDEVHVDWGQFRVRGGAD